MKKSIKNSDGNVIVWEYIMAHGLGRICYIKGNMDVALYTQILDKEFLGSLHDLRINKKDIYFQQNNDSKHLLKLATSWFKKKEHW